MADIHDFSQAAKRRKDKATVDMVMEQRAAVAHMVEPDDIAELRRARFALEATFLAMRMEGIIPIPLLHYTDIEYEPGEILTVKYRIHRLVETGLPVMEPVITIMPSFFDELDDEDGDFDGVAQYTLDGFMTFYPNTHFRSPLLKFFTHLLTTLEKEGLMFRCGIVRNSIVHGRPVYVLYYADPDGERISVCFDYHVILAQETYARNAMKEAMRGEEWFTMFSA